MSYETNPILNRIKISKGWKSSTFPTKTLNYSREMLFWFRVYLFLKVYLWCQNIKLLTCEIRISEAHTKILYLSISKYIPKKKNVKSKWKTKSVLQNLKSPLVKKQNKKTRFLLYRDLKTLKHKSEFFFNINRKKIYSKAWISKSRQSSWINFSHKIQTIRTFYKKQHNFLWRKKQKLSFLKQNMVQTQNRWKKKRNPASLNRLGKNQDFLKKFQKNIFGLLVKVQKNLLFLEKLLNKIPTQTFKKPSHSFQILAIHLRKEYQKKKIFLKKIENLYKLYSPKKIKNEKKRTLNSFSKYFATHIYQKKVNKELKPFLICLKNKWKIFQKQFFFKIPKKETIFASKKYFLKHSFLQFIVSLRKKIRFQKLEDEPLLTKINKILFTQNLHLNILFPKIKCFKTPGKLRELHIFKFLRFEQKKQLHDFWKKPRLFSKKTRKSHPQKLSYRLSFRYNYHKYLTLKTDLKLKYIIADLIQHYFLLVTHVKLFWPLKQFKNLKFYRLIFPKHQQFNLKKKIVVWNLNKNLGLQKKKYVYLGQNTNHLKIKEKILTSKKKSFLYKQVVRPKKTKKTKKTLPLLNRKIKQVKKVKVVTLKKWKKIRQIKKNSIIPQKINAKKKIFSRNLSNFWKKKLKKKNKYLVLKKKIIQTQSEKRLFWASKQLFMSNLTSTLTLFAKYLEVQPLADYLAKIIGDTKKHALILKVIKTVLRTIHFKRGIGYRIALIGRINGANKSRTFYLKKLNRNRSRQTFSKNVNFAMAQARATIGAFGVKIWVYS